MIRAAREGTGNGVRLFQAEEAQVQRHGSKREQEKAWEEKDSVDEM